MANNDNFLVYSNGTFSGEAKVWDVPTTSWYTTTFGDPINKVVLSDNNFLVYANGTFNGQAKAWNFGTKSWYTTSFSDPINEAYTD